ncbi:MAG: hypothetical protein QNJ42_25755 [Crocosphaera sp.]|nr:hypothetical protein [Crocosphaera sp.]
MPIHVYKWSGTIGHVGCQLNDRVYIGHWPKDEKKAFKNEKGDPKPLLEMDEAAVGRKYDQKVTINKLDHYKDYAIKQWNMEVSSLPYHVLENSCATMVAKALLMCVHDYISDKHGTYGGDRAMSEILYLKGKSWNKSSSPSNKWTISSISNNIWTPNDVYELAKVIRDDVSR